MHHVDGSAQREGRFPDRAAAGPLFSVDRMPQMIKLRRNAAHLFCDLFLFLFALFSNPSVFFQQSSYELLLRPLPEARV